MQDVNAMFSDAAAYERLMGRWSQKVGHKFLDWLAAKPNQSWLDVGCGNGAFTEVIQSRCDCSSLTGIDASDPQIAFARQRQGLAHADFHIGDAQNLPFADASFDVSVMALVIAFLAEPARAVAEMARVTRPDGLCATYMWDLLGGGAPLAPINRELVAMGIPAGMPPTAHISSRSALLHLWQDAGFAAIEQQTFSITVSFDDFEDFWTSNSLPAGPLSATLRKLSDKDRATLQAGLRDNLPTDATGRIAYAAFANAIKGRRAA